MITSDPNIVDIQEVTRSPITLSDYANQRFIPNVDSLSPEVISFCKYILRGDKAAGVDTRVIAGVAELTQSASRKINVRLARDIRLADLNTEDNFIFLGSPRSNPWTVLFNDQLDFRFAFDDASHQEIIRNVHPRSGELSSYVPTAKGWATGQSFATISFVQNPGKDGQVLILAGANGEGTEAAGELITNTAKTVGRFAALRHCLRETGPPFSALAATEYHGWFLEQRRRARVPHLARQFPAIECRCCNLRLEGGLPASQPDRKPG